jgi:hypothetical protein
MTADRVLRVVLDELILGDLARVLLDAEPEAILTPAQAAMSIATSRWGTGAYLLYNGQVLVQFRS